MGLIQIIGKGGFGREVEAYCNMNNYMPYAYENECNGMNLNLDAVIAIGDEEVRMKVVDKFHNQSWGVLMFGKDYGNNCKFHPGCIICPGTIITTNVVLGKHCLVNINCTIGHDCFIGDFTTLNPGVNVSGSVSIGANCNIGSNAVIKHGVTICDDVVIGAGGVVVKDITEPGIYVGNPVERMDKRKIKQVGFDLDALREYTEALYKKIQCIDAENSMHRPLM